ncbi:MAG: WD40 repeat domain-containing protein [Propionibacteriaceae bacterium]|nr:WD40 repeat domain-containing protein [Propionibacteriaceae bacterium]
MTDEMQRWTDPLTPGTALGPWRLTQRAQRPHFTGVTLMDAHRFNEMVAWETPDGASRLVSVFGKGDLRVFDTASCEIISHITVGETTSNLCMLSGSEVLLVHPTDEVSVWDLSTGELLRRFKAPHSQFTPFTAWREGKRTLFAFGSDLEGVEVRDAATGKRLDSPLRGQGFGVSGLATVTTADGRHLLAVSHRNGCLQVWEPSARKRRLVATFTPEGPPIKRSLTTVAAWRSGDDVRVAVPVGFVKEQAIAVVDALTGEVVHTITTPGLSSIDPLLVLPDPAGPRLLALSGDGTVHTWDATTGQLLTGPVVGPFEHATFATACPDGRIALAQCEGEAITFIDGVAEAPFRPVEKASWLAPSRDLHVFLGEGRKVREWDLAEGRPVGPALTSKAEALCGAALDATRVVVGYGDGMARLWDRAAEDPQDKITSWVAHEQQEVLAITAWQEGEQVRVATGGGDDTIRVWDPATRRPVGASMEHQGVRQVVAYTDRAGRRRLASGGEDCTVRFWDDEGRQVAQYVDEPGWIVGLVAFTSRRGRPRVAAASEGGELLLFDGEDGTLLASWMAPEGGSPISVTALPDHTLAYLTDIGTLHHVDPETGQELSHAGIGAHTVAALPDGSVALTRWDGWLRLEPGR